MVAETDSKPRGTEKSASRGRFLRRPFLLGAVLTPLALLSFSCSGCSPFYVARAGWTEMKILAGRTPLEEVIQDPATPEETRHKLLLTRQARAFAIHMMGLDIGDSYTTFTQVDTDVLAWIISAAHQDRLEAKTWWFPIVGRMPYRGYSSRESAEKAEADLADEGFDTYLRPTSAFSTLGWFSDPLLSTLLRYDDVELVETILHELSHNHLWVPDNVRFNESYATFVGRVGAIRFFCGPGDRPSVPEECRQAQERWSQYQAFSAFLGAFVGELSAIFDRTDLTPAEKVAEREALHSSFAAKYSDFPTDDQELGMVLRFLEAPLNNAIVLSRMRYFHRLEDFQALLDEHQGDLPAAIDALKAGASQSEDPFLLLPGTSPSR
jgi:predicted aminopeptidase